MWVTLRLKGLSCDGPGTKVFMMTYCSTSVASIKNLLVLTQWKGSPCQVIIFQEGLRAQALSYIQLSLSFVAAFGVVLVAPSNLSFLITPKPVSKYNLGRSSDSTLLSYRNVKPKATLGERAFLFAAPKLWNAVPRFIRESISIDTFKRKLKTHLFKKAFCTTQITRLYFQLTRL